MGRTLVAYATRNGSTREVAEVIGATLRRGGVEVDLRPARQPREPLVGYDLVVLGAPLYSGQWHRDAHRFLKRHRAELARIPAAVFGMGPRRGTEEAWERSRGQLDRALAKRPWLAPRATAVFGGVNPPASERRARPRRDPRDWDAIRTWAAAIPASTSPVPPETGT